MVVYVTSRAQKATQGHINAQKHAENRHLSSTSPFCNRRRDSLITEWRIWWPKDNSAWKH